METRTASQYKKHDGYKVWRYSPHTTCACRNQQAQKKRKCHSCPHQKWGSPITDEAEEKKKTTKSAYMLVTRFHQRKYRLEAYTMSIFVKFLSCSILHISMRSDSTH